jgi:hypothetical protein
MTNRSERGAKQTPEMLARDQMLPLGRKETSAYIGVVHGARTLEEVRPFAAPYARRLD